MNKVGAAIENFQQTLSKASQRFMELIEEEAKAAMTIEPTMQGFCMAMGTASFHTIWEEDYGNGEEDMMQFDEHLDPTEFPENQHALNIVAILDAANEALGLTGTPIKITRDFVNVGGFVVVTDW